jgi:hypothetical protein
VVVKSLLRTQSLQTFGITIVTRAITKRLIAERLPSSNSRRRIVSKLKLSPKRITWISVFLFEKINTLMSKFKTEILQAARMEKENLNLSIISLLALI